MTSYSSDVSLCDQPSLHGVCCGEMGSAGEGGELSANIAIVTHFSRSDQIRYFPDFPDYPFTNHDICSDCRICSDVQELESKLVNI